MAELEKETITKLTELSRIRCTPEEEEALLMDLRKILTHVEQMQEIDTSDLQPCYHVLADMHNVMRDDTVGETLAREVFLANAPSQIGGMIRVPPVIKTN